MAYPTQTAVNIDHHRDASSSRAVLMSIIPAYEAGSDGFVTGLAISTFNGMLHVVDHRKAVVKVFKDNGYPDRTFGKTHLKKPWGIFITSSGKVAISDPGARDIKLFTPDGQLLMSTTIGFHIHKPFGIAYHLETKETIIADKEMCCLFVYDAKGDVRDILGTGHPVNAKAEFSSHQPFLLSPNYVCYDHFGNMYVSDDGVENVLALSTHGRLLFRYQARKAEESLADTSEYISLSFTSDMSEDSENEVVLRSFLIHHSDDSNIGVEELVYSHPRKVTVPTETTERKKHKVAPKSPKTLKQLQPQGQKQLEIIAASKRKIVQKLNMEKSKKADSEGQRSPNNRRPQISKRTQTYQSSAKAEEDQATTSREPPRRKDSKVTAKLSDSHFDGKSQKGQKISVNAKYHEATSAKEQQSTARRLSTPKDTGHHDHQATTTHHTHHVQQAHTEHTPSGNHETHHHSHPHETADNESARPRKNPVGKEHHVHKEDKLEHTHAIEEKHKHSNEAKKHQADSSKTDKKMDHHGTHTTEGVHSREHKDSQNHKHSDEPKKHQTDLGKMDKKMDQHITHIPDEAHPGKNALKHPTDSGKSVKKLDQPVVVLVDETNNNNENKNPRPVSQEPRKEVFEDGIQHSCAGIVVDRMGNLLVADTVHSCIHLVDYAGYFRGYVLTKEDGIRGPQALALDQEGKLFLSEAKTGLIKVFRYKHLGIVSSKRPRHSAVEEQPHTPYY